MTCRKIHKWIWLGMAALACAMFLTAGVFAYWNVTGTSINVLTSSAYRAQIEEEYEIPEHVNPGTSVDKKVNVVNCGTADMLVRVRIEKMFGERDANGVLKEDPALNPELIEIVYNQNFWKYLDGYWYYTEVLLAGEKTKEPLFEQYTISEKAGNAYKGKDAEIVVIMESVQAEGDAVSLWGIEKEDLGISYIADTENTVTSVTYKGKEEGFSFGSSDTDLFANFKNLLPGCARTQKIAIKNASAAAMELFLRAETASQENMSEKQRQLVELLLSKYAVITIKQNEKILYQGPVNGNLNRAGQSMGQDISLGTYEAGKEGELIVTLSMSPEMEHDMQLLCGKVKWIFTARGEENAEAETSAVYPKTGDDMPIWQFGMLLGVSGLILVLLISMKCDALREKKKDAE